MIRTLTHTLKQLWQFVVPLGHILPQLPMAATLPPPTVA